MIDLYTVECTLNKIKIKKKYSRRTSKGRPGVQVLWNKIIKIVVEQNYIL